jgi:hypothetical protein
VTCAPPDPDMCTGSANTCWRWFSPQSKTRTITQRERSVGRLGRFDLQGGQRHCCTPPVLELEYVQKMYPKETGLQETGVGSRRPKSPQLAGSRGVRRRLVVVYVLQMVPRETRYFHIIKGLQRIYRVRDTSRDTRISRLENDLDLPYQNEA